MRRRALLQHLKAMTIVSAPQHQPPHFTIWDPVVVGRMRLPHRIAMAPMTRDRARPDGTPGDLAATYYSQRASFGLVISEGTQPSDDGQGYLLSPGIYTDAHIAGWRKVISAVHEKGAYMFIQLMHAGRMSHPDNTPHHRQPVAPSAIAPGLKMFTAGGMKEMPEPRALSEEEIHETVGDFAHAAECAVAAGADGVEIHGANGYLLQQFFAPNVNHRGDDYGGPIENRIRFALDVMTAVAERIGPDRAAIRLSPGGLLGGIAEGADGPELYRRLVVALSGLHLAYLHIVQTTDEALLRDIRRLWTGSLLVNRADRPIEALGSDVEHDLADVASVARWALANPDFLERLRAGAPLNKPDRATMFGGGAHGYTDYPFLNQLHPA